MISLLVYKRIKDRSKSDKINIPENYKNILQKYKNIKEKNDCFIFFSWASDTGSEILNASGTIPKLMIFNAEWASNVVLNDNIDTMNAFKITIGHELTHKDGDFCKLIYFGPDKNFISWINEVHADFGAAQKIFNSDRTTLIKSCQYKYDYKIKHNKKDIDTISHPSWTRRKHYVEHFDFDNELIQQIAKDVNCTNQKLIKDISEFYDEIILN